MIRRVTGNSMVPSLSAGRLVYATNFYIMLSRGDVVIIWHQGLEKIKRIQAIDGNKLYVVGDNQLASTDSRAFGWLDRKTVCAKVIWPRI
jgi:phage repressor protein C with HTH and peptisase S24 domain